MKTKINVLFLQSQSGFTSTLRVHSLLMRYYNREQVDVHVACTGTKRKKTPALKVLETIPDIHLRPTKFGPTIFRQSKINIAREMISEGLPTLLDVIGIVRYVRQHHIDIIHTSTTPREALYGIMLAKVTGIKCIIHLHSKCNDWLGSRVLRTMKQADGIIGVSAFVEQSLLSWGYAPDQVYHVLNSIDATIWDYHIDGSEIRREFAVPSGTPLLAMVALLVPWKGHELLLKALAQVKDKVPDFKLLIVGEDDPDNNALRGGRSYKDILQKLTDELGLGEHIIFTGQRSDIQQILAACDLYTMPAFEEGCGLAFLEAMAMGKAIIALDSGGAREVVEQGKVGLLSQPGDVQQLAENILTLIDDPALRSRMGEYARMRIEQHFNPQQIADEVERIYRSVLEKTIKVQVQQVPDVETVLSE